MRINRFTLLWGLLLGSTNYFCFLIVLVYVLAANIIDVKKLPFLTVSSFLIIFIFVICTFYRNDNVFIHLKFSCYLILFLCLFSIRQHRILEHFELLQVTLIATIFGVGSSLIVGLPIYKIAPNFDVFRPFDRFSAVHTSFNTLSVVLLVLWNLSKKKSTFVHIVAHWTVFSRTVLGLILLSKVVEILLNRKLVVVLCICMCMYFLMAINVRAMLDDFIHLGTLYERMTGIERALPILAENFIWGLGEGKFDALGYHETSIHNHLIRGWLEGGLIIVCFLLVLHTIVVRVRINFVAKCVLSVAPFFTPFYMPLHLLLAVSLSRVKHSSKE